MDTDDFAAWLLKLAECIGETDGLPYPIQIQVWAVPLGTRVLMAGFGNRAFETKYPPLSLDEIEAGTRR